MVKMDRRGMALLALAHAADDINQGFLPAVLPLLIVTYHFSLQAAGTIVLAQAISSSFVQPVIGYLADTRSMPWLIGAGLLLAGGGVALIGFTDSYALMFAAALASGLGVAMFHPEAARFANYVAGERKATGMRWFSLGGSLGFAFGPAYATFALALFGQRGTWLAAAPCLVMGALLFAELRRLRGMQPARPTRAERAAAPDRWPPFVLLGVYACLRSAVYVGIVAFVPLYFINELHTSRALGNMALTVYLAFGGIGVLVGGPVADRIGRRPILRYTTLATGILLVAFVALAHSVVAGYVLIAIIGFVMVSSNTALVVLGQEYLPNHLGIASGVTFGIGVSVGGMMSPLFGAIGDRYGLDATFYTAAVIAAVATAMAFVLPPETRRIPATDVAAT